MNIFEIFRIDLAIVPIPDPLVCIKESLLAEERM